MAISLAQQAANLYAPMEESERQDVIGEYSNLRQGLQTNIFKRGIGRSGFAGESMGKLAAAETGAMGELEGDQAGRRSAWVNQQLAAAAARRRKKKKKKKGKWKKWTGAALGIAGLVLAPFTGGASLALTATGAQMYMAN